MSERSPAMDIADLIRDSESGWAVYVGNEAPSPDNAVTVYDTGGGQANADGPLYDPTIQVRVRSADYVTGYTKAIGIRDMLMIRTARRIGDWHYTGFWLISDVAKIGRDDSDRELFTVNFRMMRERVPAPPSCAVTITGDIATAVGGQPMTISGQTASYTLTETPTIWAASTPVDSLFMPPESGVIAFELGFEVAGTTTPFAGISGLVHRLQVVRLSDSYAVSLVEASTSTGLAYNNVPIAPESTVALGLSSDGTPVILVDGEPLGLVDAGTDEPYDLSGLFVGGGVLVAIEASNSSSGSGSITFRTAGTDFTQTYPAGTLDWCGNPI